VSEPYHETPEALCPYCGHLFTHASNVEDDAPPEPDDATICIGCGEALLFTAHLGVRKPTVEETDKLRCDQRVQAAQRIWRRLQTFESEKRSDPW
jgi:hypothetical protein